MDRSCKSVKKPDLDLLLIDMNMPVMGGFEAAKLIREFNNKIIIIAQTANGMEKIEKMPSQQVVLIIFQNRSTK
jgi:CheY-like chemotaxis protein